MLDPILKVECQRENIRMTTCLICNSQSNVPFVLQPIETSCMKVFDFIVRRVLCGDDNCVFMRDRIGDNVTLESFPNKDFKWHAECYKTFFLS